MTKISFDVLYTVCLNKFGHFLFKLYYLNMYAGAVHWNARELYSRVQKSETASSLGPGQYGLGLKLQHSIRHMVLKL